MSALRIHRCRTVNKVTDAKQTAFLTHVVETCCLFCANKTTVQNSYDNTFAVISHVMQLIDFQLKYLVMSTTVKISVNNRFARFLHLVGKPNLLVALCFRKIRAVSHYINKLQSVDGVNDTLTCSVNRHSVQPF